MNKNTFMCDFETTVYDGQDHTEVWASAVVRLWTEDVKIFGSLPDTFEYFISLRSDCILYYHNLKFDGTFWLDYLMKDSRFKQALDSGDSFFKTKLMPDYSFKYLISDMGQWYDIIIKVNGYIIEIRDSLKLLPFSVARIGKSFKTKHQKLDMEYTGYRYAGCIITDKEKEYIANDVLVPKEALEIMFDEGHTKLTIGACCLDEFRKSIGEITYGEWFPDLTQIEIDEDKYGSTNVDAYIRKSYHGGWCYVVKGKENQIYKKGLTADVNSLYPSMMSGASGNTYPVGKPKFWKGNFPKHWDGKKFITLDEDKEGLHFWFVRIKTRFKLRQGYLPTIQIKGNPFYKATEWLETSDIRDPKTGKYFSVYRDKNGDIHDARVTLTLTMVDYFLMLEHYEVYDFEILDGCYFEAVPASWIFDSYMLKYKKIKMESTGSRRELAKLFLNNCYGKLASSTNSSYKVAVLDEENESIDFKIIFAEDKKAGYIAVGSAITSYARNFTIRTAQKNFYGADKRGFIYADTDSIHCDLLPEELVGVPVHPTEFCHWKIESCWDKAVFVRQKTYIEHVVEEDLEPIDNPYYNVKCAGMPEKAKSMFIASMEGKIPDGDWNERQLEFMHEKRTLSDFKIGLLVPEGKLMPKRISGGTILVPSDYQIRRAFL